MRKLTIVHLFSGDLWAGAEVMTYNLVKELSNYKYIKIITVSLNEGVLAEKLRKAGVEVHVVPENKNSLPGIFFQCLKILKNRNIDILHSHRYKENILALFLGKTMGVKCLINTLHGLPEIPKDKKYGFMNVALMLNNQIIKRFFTFTVSVSNEIKEILMQNFKFGANKVCVIYNGIPKLELANVKAKSPEEKLHIGSVGRLVDIKNFSLFLDLASKLRLHKKDIKFSILGAGPLRDELVRKSENLNLDDCFTIIPETKNPFPYYQSLDIYVNTSLHEGIPLSILEAMACKKPVVASAVGGIPEIITDGQNGFLIKNHDCKNYADTCLALLQDSALRNNIGENAYSSIMEKFSVSRMADSYNELYKQCMA